MRKRLVKYLLLLTLATPTLFVACPAGVGLELLNSVMTGVNSAAQSWTASAVMDFLRSLEPQEEP